MKTLLLAVGWGRKLQNLLLLLTEGRAERDSPPLTASILNVFRLWHDNIISSSQILTSLPRCQNLQELTTHENKTEFISPFYSVSVILLPLYFLWFIPKFSGCQSCQQSEISRDPDL